MTLTRDSWLWILTIIGAVAGYFATVPPPTEWTWPQAMNAIVVLAGFIAAKLSGSGLAGDTTPLADTVTKFGVFKVYDKR